jgi:hypothetical protein
MKILHQLRLREVGRLSRHLFPTYLLSLTPKVLCRRLETQRQLRQHVGMGMGKFLEVVHLHPTKADQGSPFLLTRKVPCRRMLAHGLRQVPMETEMDNPEAMHHLPLNKTRAKETTIRTVDFQEQ